MIKGRPDPDFNQVSELSFEYYAQAHRRRVRKNTNKARTVGAIAVYLSGNDQGGGLLCL